MFYKHTFLVFLDFFRKCKVIPQLQESLLTFFFNCMSVSTPLKTEIAEHTSDKGYLDFSVSSGPSC